MRRITKALIVIGIPSLSACFLPGGHISPYGRTAVIHPVGGSRVSGELIAAAADTVWLMRDDTVTAFPRSRIEWVQVRRHRFGGKATYKWMALAGAGTGAALALSCSIYESSGEGGGDTGGCFLVLPATTLLFLAGGTLFAALNHYSAHYTFLPSDTAQLRAHSRYPQGLPDALRAPPPSPF